MYDLSGFWVQDLGVALWIDCIALSQLTLDFFYLVACLFNVESKVYFGVEGQELQFELWIDRRPASAVCPYLLII